MASQAYFSVKGNIQDQFKGEASEAQRSDKWMVVLSFAMDLKSPHDVATGQPSERVWEPIKVVKAWGAASPQFLTACATNEVLSEVAFEFMKTSPSGEEYVYKSITLSDATIAGVVRFTGQPGAPQELEEISMTFRKIELTDTDSKLSFSDDWASNR